MRPRYITPPEVPLQHKTPMDGLSWARSRVQHEVAPTSELGGHIIRISAAAASALKAGKKVEAVKITREANGASLKESLSAVNDYLVNNHLYGLNTTI